MQKMLLGLAASGLLLAAGTAIAQAPQSPTNSGTDQDRSGTVMQHRATSEHAGKGPMMGQNMDDRMKHGGGHMKSGGGHMMHGGRHGPNMLVMMMAMMDANGDRALSLPEVQAVHERIFQYADADEDGKLTLEEMRDFFHGGAFDPDQ